MDRIMFGDNQFFGVNHMSEEKARAMALRFQDTQAILDVLGHAYDAGIRTFMCTTHDRMAEIVDRVATDRDRFQGLVFHPGMPYAHKYADMVTELGIFETLRQVTPGGIFEAVARGAKTAVKKDLRQLMYQLVDAELVPFASVEVPVVFLQNVIADLLLGLGMRELLAEFVEYVQNRHGARAGVFTMNMPRMLDALVSEGISNPIICCNYNAVGFRMCGGIEAYDRALEGHEFTCIAMSVLASGAIEPERAIAWICDRPRVDSIVFGASSRGNIARTVELIEKYSKC